MNRPTGAVATTGSPLSTLLKDMVHQELAEAARTLERFHGKPGMLLTLVCRYPNDVQSELVISMDPDLLAVVDVLVRRKRVELEADRAGQGS